MVLIIHPNRHLAALPGELLRADFFSVQLIGNVQLHRKRFVCLSLVINILSAGLPGNRAVAVCNIRLVALDIFDLTQIRFILKLSCALRIFQSFADNHAFRASCCIRHDVDRLLLLRLSVCIAFQHLI